MAPPLRYPEFTCDSMHGVMVAGWISLVPHGRIVSGRTFGAMKVRCHLGPSLYIGNSTEGWENIEVVEPYQAIADGDPLDCQAFSCGLWFLPNSECRLVYSTSGFYAGSDMRYSRAHGIGHTWANGGPPDGFTGVGGPFTPSPTGQNRVSASGFAEQELYQFQLPSLGIGDDIIFVKGELWTTLPAFVYPVRSTDAWAALGPTCGGAWRDNEWGLLYTKYAGSNNIYYLSSGDPSTWPAGPGIDTTFTGRVCGMAKHPSGRLVAAIQDLGSNDTSAIYSDDAGATWVSTGPLGISAFPYPLITCIGDVLYIVYMIDDVVHFAASTDAGSEWTLNFVTTDGATRIMVGTDELWVS